MSGCPTLSTGSAVLHPRERQRLLRMRHERRRADYLAGRRAVKAAVTHLRDAADPTAIWVEPGALHQPVLGGPGTGGLAVSLAHSHHLGAAVAFDVAHPVGVDLERVDPARAGILQSTLTAGERTITAGLGLAALTAATAVWTAKEALAKFLRVGLSVDLSLLEVATWRTEGEWWRLDYRHVVSLKALLLVVDDWVLALCLPARSTVSTPDVPDSLAAALLDDISRTLPPRAAVRVPAAHSTTERSWQ
ncbi:4'-phosphopantetheinyl transferase superfamily protein [Micromonospora sp. WMMD1120]|uniref:4'-phosphopantetheinyl transferase family protein n=1 Tax=Micromonospora sp. WMMD1120 TaxID=3016106 RepID=UPI0024180876|nr:4'-phosphopantetheinyl transferase family protein [Micromonospora sp. WMMD1120]MDG4810848.1 4'-phosphopantetheinyl transferase superfamily protein [Micromonospora sp. WMMD1120]